MYHSRLTFVSNRHSAPGNAAGIPMTAAANSPFADRAVPLEFELYQHAYLTNRGQSAPRASPPDRRAA